MSDKFSSGKMTRKMRNGELATYRKLVEPTGEFQLLGTDEDGHPHLWRTDGKWREFGQEHPFDLLLS